MNGSRIGGVNKNRSTRTIKVAPTTRAIRAALAVSATMLALSGSGAALAGTCSITALNTVTCTGVFVDTIPGVHFVPSVDMTLVLGGALPTSVTPAAGSVGIDATWGGNVTVISYADITTDGADGVNQYGSTSASLTNHGDILTNVTAAGANAVDISAFGDVTVVNDGVMFAYNNAAENVLTLVASSIDGNISIDNQLGGSISASAYNGTATAIVAQAYGSVDVNNDGTIYASSFNNAAAGVIAIGVNGDATVTNSGTIHAYSLNTGGSLGIEAVSVNGDATIDNSGSIAAGGEGQSIGVFSVSGAGNAYVDNSGTIEATSYLGTAVGVISTSKYASGGDATIDNSGSVSAAAYTTALGMVAISASGNAYVDNSGSVYASSVDGNAYGVLAVAKYAGSYATVDSSGTVSVTGYDTSIGIAAVSDFGSTVNNDGSVSATSSDYDATGIIAVALNGDTNVTGSGSVTATAYYDTAMGIDASAPSGSVTVDVTGDISATTGNAYYAVGIGAYGYSGATVTTGGNVYAGGGYAYGVIATANGYNGDVSVTNSTNGDISASGYNYASGIQATASGTYGDVTVVNNGDVSANGYYSAFGIEATASGLGGTVSVTSTGTIAAYAGDYYIAAGILAQGDSNVSIGNSGSIYATAKYAYGAAAISDYGNATVSNSGTISVVTADKYYSVGMGVLAIAEFGDVTVDNSGSISVDAKYGTGVYAASADGDVSVTNSGTINVYALATGYFPEATGINAYSANGDVTVNSSGSIYAGSTYAYGYAYGVIAASVNGDVTVINSGDIDVVASKYAYGVLATSTDGSVSVDNSGTIATDGLYGSYGVIAASTNYYATVSNSGSINASSPDGVALGVVSQGYLGASVTNSGTISATSQYLVAAGVIASSYNGTSVVNSGNINASGYYAAYGVIAQDIFGDVTVNNSGSIDVYAGPGNVDGGLAIGVQASDVFGAITVTNSGTITVESNSFSVYAGSATGISAENYDGDVSVNNSGVLGVTAVSDNLYYGATAIGVDSYTVFGDTDISNTGSISAVARTIYFAAYGETTATGVNVTDIFGDTTINNGGGGSISAEATATDGSANATGVYALGIYGNISIYSEGAVSASATTGDYDSYVSATAVGISGVNLYLGNVYVGGAGNIDVSAATGYGSDFSNANATGINAESIYGSVDVYTRGDVTVSATTGDDSYDNQADAYGVVTYNYGGGIFIYNTGNIDVSASSGAGSYLSYANATGVSALITVGGEGGIVIRNLGNGSITATAEDNATGVSVHSYGTGNYGNVFVANYGDVTATANGGELTRAVGVSVNAYDVFAYQSGDVTASATGTDEALAIGVYLDAIYADFLSGSDSNTDATATGYNDAGAYGVVVSGFSSDVYAEGAISATATADTAVGQADAIGLFAIGYYANVETTAGSSISVSAEGYSADAFGLFAIGSTLLTLDNAGDIDALATGTYGDAIGMLGVSNNGLVAFNSGDITAEFDGSGGDATGVQLVSSYDDVVFYNSGNIDATDADYAVGVALYSNYYTTLFNAGTISSHSTAAGSIAILTGDSQDYVSNSGTINGAIVTGDGDDYLYNEVGAVWNAIGYSDFGGGDDEIVNRGTINMTNASIDMGTYSADGNAFYNFNEINLSGDNYIDMGGPIALVPSLNPLAFYNYGVLDFQDGAPNDTLTITGDFAGDGDINVDVSGLLGTSDLLYIDGSVVVSTDVQTINVNLLNLPNIIETEIPIVFVSGNSAAGDFGLGTVNFNPNNSFVTLDFSLVSHINAANTADDVFALAIDISGLNDPGTIAASIAPSVQSLMNTQTGTWRQRMGVIDQFNKGAVSLWARIFRDKGGFTPDHVAANFGQGGNFDWDQRNSGIEAGVDFAVTDELSLGLLLAKADADVHLSSPGVGHSDLTSDTWGVYGTWISPSGFYLDASYRWMNFDTDLTSVAGPMHADGDATSFNIEAGFAWTMASDWKLEPQFQYTRTNVDEINVLATSTGMTFQANGGDSSRGRLGLAVRKSFGDADTGWQWTPYATLSAVREFDGQNTYAINNTFFGETSVEGTSALLELGFTARTGNWALYGGVNWQDGGAVDSFVGGQLGVRYTFGGAAPAPAPVAAAPAKTCADLDDDGDGVNNCDDKCLGSTAGQAVGPDGCPVPLTIDLKGVNFDFDQSTLRPDAVAILDEAIAILGKYPDLKVEVAGHTDAIGTEQYNQGLSERRAQTVYDYLAGHGIDAGRMVGPTGYGESRPIAPNTNEDGSDNPEGRARNRRTELNVQN